MQSCSPLCRRAILFGASIIRIAMETFGRKWCGVGRPSHNRRQSHFAIVLSPRLSHYFHMPESENPKLDDSIKLAIRDEVERRFEHPPDAFSKRVEDEVKRRVADKEKWYRAYAIIASLALTSILFVWYHATLATVGEKVVEQLAEKRVTEARDRIMNSIPTFKTAASECPISQNPSKPTTPSSPTV